MDYGHKLTDDELKELEKRISAEYSQAEKEVSEKLADYLSAFARKDEEQKALVEAGEITEKEYLNWRVGQIAIGQRWDALRNNLAEDYHNANKIAKSMTTEQSKDIYALNYNYGVFEVESATDMDTGFVLYDKSTVERLMRDDPQMLPPPGKKVSERIKAGEDVLWNNQQIQSVMMQSLLQGEPIPKIANRLAKAVGDSNKVGAIRNARTMTTGAENAGRVDSYKRADEKGIKIKQMWIATLDERTRQSHRDLDGQSVEPGETFSNGCEYPGDPKGAPEEVYNCRCTLVAKFPEIPYTFAERGTNKEEYLEWKKGKEEQAAKSEPISKKEEPKKVEEAKVEELHCNDEQVVQRFEKIKGGGKIDYLEVDNLDTVLTSEQIIEKLAGGDMTSGSCSSLAIAYTANRCGLDVTDYRGGDSRAVFAQHFNAVDFYKLANADIQELAIERKVASTLAQKLQELDENKEYVLLAGKHASVVRKLDGVLQYLEMQSSLDSGWINFERTETYDEYIYNGQYKTVTRKYSIVDTLQKRFRVAKTQPSVFGMKIPEQCAIIDISTAQPTEEFKDILGLINTNTKEQKKGATGYEK